ncbi:MAG: type II toxin-antitoxin system RelE/ParE family toxin [Spirochaetota bacterium]
MFAGIQSGAIAGNVYVEAEGFELVSGATIDESSTVTGETRVEDKNSSVKPKVVPSGTTAAAEDLSEIATYIAEDSPGAATASVERVDRAVRQLKKQPRSGRIVPELEHQSINRYREFILSPWRLFYRYDREVVFVLSIIDGRRDMQDILLRRLTRSESRED